MPLSHGRATSAGRLSLCSAILVSLAGLTALRADDGKRPSAPTAGKTAAPAPPTFDLRILDPDGKPVPNAKVELRSTPNIQAEHVRIGKFERRDRYGANITSDAGGQVVFERAADTKHLDVYVKELGYAFFWAGWDPLRNSEPIPASLTARLEPAWTVGGVVVDRDRKPVPNVRVSFRIEFTKRPGDQSQFGIGAQRWTNNIGQWSFESVPVLLRAVPVEISDPKFATVRRKLSRSEFGIERGKTPSAEIVLSPGLVLTGRVTDEKGKPIAKALVRTKFQNDRHSAITAADGTYQLEGCESGEARVVASANGRATQLKVVRVDSRINRRPSRKGGSCQEVT